MPSQGRQIPGPCQERLEHKKLPWWGRRRHTGTHIASGTMKPGWQSLAGTLPESGVDLGSPGFGGRGGKQHRYTLDLIESWTVWKVGQWLRAAVVPKETSFKRGTEAHCVGTSCAAARPKRQEYGLDLFQLSAPHRLSKGVQSKWLVSTSLTQQCRVERVSYPEWRS